MAGVGAQASARETAELTMKAKAEDKITIYGPKSDGTYIVEFRTAAGEALAISIPRTEATVIRHFQRERPSSVMVGRVGSACERVLLVTARPRNNPGNARRQRSVVDTAHGPAVPTYRY